MKTTFSVNATKLLVGLTKFTFLIFIVFLFNSCKKELLQDSGGAEIRAASGKVSLKKMSYQSFLSKVDVASTGTLGQLLTKAPDGNRQINSTSFGILSGFSISADSVDVLKVGDTLSYVLSIKHGAERSATFYNLTIAQHGENVQAFVTTYKPSKNWIDQKRKGMFVPFTGKIGFSRVSFEGNGSGTVGNRAIQTGWECETYTVYYRVDYPCIGEGSDQHWPDETCQLDGKPGAPYSELVASLQTDCSYTGGSGTPGTPGDGTGGGNNNGGNNNNGNNNGNTTPIPPRDYRPCTAFSDTGEEYAIPCEDNGTGLPLTALEQLVEDLDVTNATQMSFLAANPDLVTQLQNYHNANGKSLESKDFVGWAVAYLTVSPSININQFLTEFFPTGTELVADPNGSWTDPDNEMLVDLDQTVYQQYQDNQPWPTISPIINYEKFVPNRYIPGTNPPVIENCFVLAKEQLAKKGYTVGGYYVNSPQIFQAYQGTSVNLIKAREGISYIMNALSNSIPVLVGVDVRAGSSNADNTTDHFIVIVGMGTDNKGKYFQFYDSSTNYAWLGASKENKLYFDSTTGKISGKTKSQYANLTGHHDFVVTQIRKSIKK
ncbi:MAG: hypothetical protein REI64_00820 [Pedobacter sp.]|uniref:hypothetical protein n=1 Tax=Pedobacter sp. TaxID=1411316 RepID=UPI002808254D|nr:hypothetical protein [Pedobacter sp.]MDQ8003305.1 hypothetical protein [Pedobacter sp.]